MPAIGAVLVDGREIAFDFPPPTIGRRHRGGELANTEAAVALHVDFRDLRHVAAGPGIEARLVYDLRLSAPWMTGPGETSTPSLV